MADLCAFTPNRICSKKADVVGFLEKNLWK